jgi:hypothetical protein
MLYLHNFKNKKHGKIKTIIRVNGSTGAKH